MSRDDTASTTLRGAAIVFGAALGQGGGFPGLYFSTLPIFLKPIAQTFQWNRASTAGVAVASMLGLSAAAPLAGWMMDRYGVRKIIGISTLTFSAGLFALSSLPGSLALFAATSCALGALGVATGPTGYALVLSRTFDRRLGLALSIAMVGVGIGAALAPSLAQALITAGGWRHAYRVMSAAALCIGGLALALILRAPNGPTTRPRTSRPPTAPDEPGLPASALMGHSLRQALRRRAFWTLLCAGVLVAACGLGANIHLSALLSDAGMSEWEAARVAGAVGAGILVGRLICGVLLDWLFAPLVGALLLLPGAIGLGLIGFDVARTFAMYAVCAFLLGFSVGTEADFLAFVVRRYFGLRAFGVIFGLLFAGYCLGAVVGPVLFGAVYDASGRYGVAVRCSAAGLALASAILMTLGRYQYAKQAHQP